MRRDKKRQSYLCAVLCAVLLCVVYCVLCSLLTCTKNVAAFQFILSFFFSPQAAAWTIGGDKTKFVDINPKSIIPEELYGYITMATREWKDGLLSKVRGSERK